MRGLQTDVRATGPLTGGIPSAMGRVTSVKQFSQREIVIEGCDLIGTVDVPVADPATGGSAVLGSVDLNPSLVVPGGRLEKFAELFDKYRYEALEVVYITNVGTTTNGCLQVIADPDPLDDYTGLSGDALNQAMVGQLNNMEIPIYENACLKVKDKSFFSQALYVDPSTTTPDGKRWSSPGKIWWACMGPLPAAVSYGRLFLKYKIRFMEPSNDSEQASGESFIYASSGTYVSSQFPFGNYSLIRTLYKTTAGLACNPRPYVTFRSDPTLGSVIQFNSEGFYLLKILRTGAAMGTGAFSAAVLKDCVGVWPSNESQLTTYNNSLSNGGSTISAWIVTIYANKPGATLSSTNDSGVTHTSAMTCVSKLNLNKNTSSDLNMALQQRLAELDAKFNKLAIERLKPSPKLGEALTVSETATITTPGTAGGPQTTSTVTLSGAVSNGDVAVNVVTPGTQPNIPFGYVLTRAA